MLMKRRSLVLADGAAAVSASLSQKAQERRFAARPGAWREFEMTTRIEIKQPKGASRVWVPLPSIDSDHQRPLDDSWSGNAASTRIVDAAKYTISAREIKA